jgi:hypothetical protein
MTVPEEEPLDDGIGDTLVLPGRLWFDEGVGQQRPVIWGISFFGSSGELAYLLAGCAIAAICVTTVSIAQP